MQNAKHIGCMWALAVALGLGMAIANTPAVASAESGNSDKGSSAGESSGESSGDSSGESSSKKSESSADASSKKEESSADDEESSSRSPRTSTTGLSGPASTADAEGDDKKTRSNPEAEDDEAADEAADDSAEAPESSTDRALSPIVPSPPDEPVEPPAASALLTLSRRDVDPGVSTPSATVDPPASQVTNGRVIDSADTSPDEVTTAAEPGFISSTRGFFGLFTLTSAGDPEDNNYVAVVLEIPFFTIVLTSGTDPEDNLGFGAASIGRAGHTVLSLISPFGNFSAGIPIEDPFAELFIDLIRAGVI
jgi:hypothetical protein